MKRTTGAILAMLGAGILGAGCRESPTPPRIEDRPPLDDSHGLRLTFSRTNERSPTWSPDGDTVYFVSDGWEELAASHGALLAIPAAGGAAAVALPALQLAGPNEWLMAPAPRPGADALALVEVWFRRVRQFCDGEDPGPGELTTCSPGSWLGLAPRVEEIRLRVRGRADRGVEDAITPLRVSLDAYEWDESVHPYSTVPALERYVDPPSLVLMRTEEAIPFTPSWAPDGARLVFSDGWRLRVWTPGSTEAVAIPGTDDGITPAWSPDGSRIAFTRLERGDSITHECTRLIFGLPACVLHSTIYPVRRRAVAVISPEGGEPAEVAEGDEPAWTPDGRIVYRADGTLRLLDPETGTSVPIPDTEGGRDPAVSPDGGRLAFSRRSGNGSWDLWIVALPQP